MLQFRTTAHAAIAALALTAFAAPLQAEKTPKPKPGTVIKDLRNCKDSPPTCFVLARGMAAGDGVGEAAVPAADARRPLAEGTLPAGRTAYGCLSRDGTITVTANGCPKGTLVVVIVLKD